MCDSHTARDDSTEEPPRRCSAQATLEAVGGPLLWDTWLCEDCYARIEGRERAAERAVSRRRPPA